MKSSRSKADEDHVRALEAWDAGNLDLAFSLLSSCARLGDPGAQMNLGLFYDEELENPRQGLYWYHKSYKSGSSAAAINIGVLHREQGDARKAAWWFRKSASMGDGEAALELGKCYVIGYGTAKSPLKAKALFQQAIASRSISDAGVEEATAELEKLEKLEKRQKRQKR